MEDEDIAPNTNTQLIKYVGIAESRACTLRWNIVYWHDFLPIQLYAFSAISASSFLHPILYTTYYSMGDTHKGETWQTFCP